MTEPFPSRTAPLVSIVICACGGRAELSRALGSVLRQSYPEIQVVVVNPAAESIADVVRSLNHPRVVLVESGSISGKAGALNRALQYAEGRYVAYLDDAAVFYPNHVERLVRALEGPTDCLAAYSDFYLTYCRPLPDGRREVLAKHLYPSREFDRLCLCRAGRLLGVSLMHRRDLLEQTGSYNEAIRALVDWEVTRRLAFFTDFLHVGEITGELRCFAEGSTEGDAAGHAAGHFKEALTIRATRPAKPWPKMPDLSILFAPERLEGPARQVLRQIRTWTFLPYQVYVPLPADELEGLDGKMPNVVPVPVEPGRPIQARIDQALWQCQGDHAAVVPERLPIGRMWVEPAVHTIWNSSSPKRAVRLGWTDDAPWAAVARTDELRAARRRHPGLSVRESLQAEGFLLGTPAREELPFQFDMLLSRAQVHEAEGNWHQAVEVYQRMLTAQPNKLTIQHCAARALYQAGGQDEQALRVCRQINRQRPTVESLLLEARLHRRADRTRQAIQLLEEARRTLQWKG